MFGRKLDLENEFMYRLVDTLIELYGEIFPELPAQKEFIIQVIKAEESSFRKNLHRGIRLFEELVSNLRRGERISGKDVFVLYDTYGFPSDMTAQMAEERG